LIQDFYNKLSEHEKKIFYITVIAVLFAFVDRLFLDPVLTKLRTLDEAIVKQENSIKRDLRFLSYKDRILKEKNTLSIYYTTEYFTEEEIIAGFLKRIEILATNANVNLIKVTPSEGKQKKGHIEYSAMLECSGTLEQTIRFMHLMDTSPELIKIMKFTIVPGKGDEGLMKSNMTVARIMVEAEDLVEEQMEGEMELELQEEMIPIEDPIEDPIADPIEDELIPEEEQE